MRQPEENARPIGRAPTAHEGRGMRGVGGGSRGSLCAGFQSCAPACFVFSYAVVILDVLGELNDVDVIDRVRAAVAKSAHDVEALTATALPPLPGFLPDAPPVRECHIPFDAACSRASALLDVSANRRLALKFKIHPRPGDAETLDEVVATAEIFLDLRLVINSVGDTNPPTLDAAQESLEMLTAALPIDSASGENLADALSRHTVLRSDLLKSLAATIGNLDFWMRRLWDDASRHLRGLALEVVRELLHGVKARELRFAVLDLVQRAERHFYFVGNGLKLRDRYGF